MAGFWQGFKTGLYDIFTFGGYSKEREREKQEELNKLQMEREDNAYQRTVEDMNKAGLNPLTMSGTNNAQPLTNPIKGENTTFDKAIQLTSMIASVAAGLAQAKNLNASTTGQGIQNAIDQKELDNLNNRNLSRTEYEHERQKELAILNKGFWGKVGNDIYYKLDEGINSLIDKGTKIVNQGIDSLGKGEFGEVLNEKVEELKDKGADILVEKTGKYGERTKKYGEWRKKNSVSGEYQLMQYYQSEIDYWSRVPNPENLKKVNEFRKLYKEAEKRLEEKEGKHWREYLFNK